MHFIEKKDGSGLRPTTLADCRRLNLLPSVTTITKTLAAPALTQWLKRTAAIAAITTPRLDGESVDDFLDRVIAVDSESIGDAAKQRGSDVHSAIESALGGKSFSFDWAPFVKPVLDEVAKLGDVVSTEKIMLGKRYAGRCDLICESDECITVVDFKTTGAAKLPSKSYPEHRLQLSAYAHCIENAKPIQTANIYISTARPGEIKVTLNDNWQDDYAAFDLVVRLWGWVNNFDWKE